MTTMTKTLARTIASLLGAGVFALGIVGTQGGPEVLFRQAAQDQQQEVTTTTVAKDPDPTTTTVPAPVKVKDPKAIPQAADTHLKVVIPENATPETVPPTPATTVPTPTTPTPTPTSPPTTKVQWRLIMPDGTVYLLDERPNYTVCSEDHTCWPAEYKKLVPEA